MTLDDDLAVRLEQRRAERGMTFKGALNDAVRRGLAGDPARDVHEPGGDDPIWVRFWTR